MFGAHSTSIATPVLCHERQQHQGLQQQHSPKDRGALRWVTQHKGTAMISCFGAPSVLLFLFEHTPLNTETEKQKGQRGLH